MSLRYLKYRLVAAISLVLMVLASCSQGGDESPKNNTTTGLKENAWEGMSCYEYVTRRQIPLEKSFGINDIVAKLAESPQKPDVKFSVAQKAQEQKLRQQLQNRLIYLFHQLNTKLESEMQKCVFVQSKSSP